MKPYHRRCRGYSLIELLTVLVIVGILAMVGVMTLGSRHKPAVRELTQQLASSIADAKQLARSVGRQVTLHVRGTTPSALSIDFEYLVPDPPPVPLPDPYVPTFTTIRGGGFSMAAQGSSSAYAVPGIARSPITATSVSTDSLAALSLVTNWATFFVDANAVFRGSETSTLTFSNSGQISSDCYMTVSEPSPHAGSPVGLVIISRRNGIHAYYFSGDAGATWRSL